jgi:hypothetical protein
MTLNRSVGWPKARPHSIRVGKIADAPSPPFTSTAAILRTLQPLMLRSGMLIGPIRADPIQAPGHFAGVP